MLVVTIPSGGIFEQMSVCNLADAPPTPAPESPEERRARRRGAGRLRAAPAPAGATAEEAPTQPLTCAAIFAEKRRLMDRNETIAKVAGSLRRVPRAPAGMRQPSLSRPHWLSEERAAEKGDVPVDGASTVGSPSEGSSQEGAFIGAPASSAVSEICAAEAETESATTELIFTACSTGVVHKWALDKQLQSDFYHVRRTCPLPTRRPRLCLAPFEHVQHMSCAADCGHVHGRPQQRACARTCLLYTSPSPRD